MSDEELKLLESLLERQKELLELAINISEAPPTLQ